MKFLKSHFALSRSQQNGIFVLVLIIIGFQIFLFLDFSSESEVVDQSEIEGFQRQLDSLNRTASKRKDTIYPFNPNYITDFKGYQLGMNLEEIDRLLVFRNSGKWINSSEDFQKVTDISDSLLKKISPSFRFPEWTQKVSSINTFQNNLKTSEMKVSDLNAASAEDFKAINGIGEVLSQRIVKYRSSIGGFLNSSQLKDVYGLSPEVIARIDQKFTILSKPDIAIKNLNSITEAELSEIPYFNDQLAREIISYRKLHEGISSFEELSKINTFPYDKIDRIKLYLAIE
ncbi:helix-hairpin-helix domain-containing protein [Gramella sp. MAR_2010_147]|uniref:ComEA family DNA-binding protein n=1 Tax=Gramella sp. MAR_2010_147 TaxID=1250205 RepID=UPI00087BCA92|nr:helix-hairpin-helix domain-containing protein [Gramella sp. MAR_2010_147]SDS69556.1 DNA uptake protein ComE [Gramella sp. MAR_2010_147]